MDDGDSNAPANPFFYRRKQNMNRKRHGLRLRM